MGRMVMIKADIVQMHVYKGQALALSKLIWPHRIRVLTIAHAIDRERLCRVQYRIFSFWRGETFLAMPTLQDYTWCSVFFLDTL